MANFWLPPFKNDLLWQQAMTHSSFAHEQMQVSEQIVEHNERLEFLGDAILNFVSGSYLYLRYPNRSEGELTPIRAALVDKPQLCHFAQLLKLGDHLRLGKGADQEGARQSARLLCSAFEAMVGAYFLDCDRTIQPVIDYVESLFDSVIEQAIQQSLNPKSQLQEWAQRTTKDVPKYTTIASSGPDHEKSFVVEVKVGGASLGVGQGPSKKEAEKAAATAALAISKQQNEL